MSDRPVSNPQGEPSDVPAFIDTRQVRRAADRAAAHYNAHATIEREIGRRMLERLDYVRIAPRCVLDLGCAAGAAMPALLERYPEARVIGVDHSLAMLRAGQPVGKTASRWMPFQKASRSSRICADAQAMPVMGGVAQLVWSNLLLLWCNDPLAAIREMYRVLDVEGLLMFTTFGPDTLKELRACFSDGAAHTQRFADMHDVGDMLVEVGFSDPVMDMEVITLTYPDVDLLLADLRASGATCAAFDRPKGLFGRNAWQSMRAAYEKKRCNGRLPVTLEVVYGHAWKGLPKGTRPERSVVHFDRTGRSSSSKGSR